MKNSLSNNLNGRFAEINKFEYYLKYDLQMVYTAALTYTSVKMD